jgi:hypothetical protein
MADKKISALTGASTPLAGTEVLPIVQSGATVKVAVSDLTAGRAVATGALTVTGALSATGTLSGGTSGTGYSFSGSAPATSVTLDASGNFGVGTATPAAYGGSAFTKIVNSGSLNSISGAFSDNVTGTLRVAHASNQNILNFDTTALCIQSGGTIPTERMRITDAGIVTMNAYGAGAATFSAAGVISSVSDETWKIKDGVPTDPDAMLKKLEPGYWYYNDEKKETFGTDRQLGFYAQNVNAAIGPEAAPTPETFITKNEEGIETTVAKPWGYYDRSVLAITVMSLQKALKDIEALTLRIAALEAK